MKFKTMKLASKTAVVIGTLLLIMLLVLTLFSVGMAKGAITPPVRGEFSGMAAQNGQMVQSIVDDASMIAVNLISYMENTYASFANMGDAENIETKRSAVYNVAIQRTAYDIESYILNNAWAALINNPDIDSVAAMFEPTAFDSAVKAYSLYITTDDAYKKRAASMGVYTNYSQQPYYALVKESGGRVVTKPYLSEGKMVCTIAYPVIYYNRMQGVIAVNINVENFNKVKSTDEKYPTMYVDILTHDNTIVYNSQTTELVGVNMAAQLSEKDYAKIVEGQAANEAFSVETLDTSGNKVSRFFYPVSCANETWWAVSILQDSDLNKSINAITVWMLLVSATVLIVILVATALVLKRLMNPLQSVLHAADEIAQGRFDLDIQIKTEDEIGQLAKAFDYMACNLKDIIRDIYVLLETMADGNFKVDSQCAEKYVGQYSEILVAIRQINGHLSSTLLQINQASQQVSSGAEQVSGGAQALSQGATEQASAIQELSASITEISDHIRQNAENALRASSLSEETVREVAFGNQHMHNMIEAMYDISEASNQIGKIIKTIDDIAFQTNILALNAAVEAARAGEAGKGFAVVADEVRNLASKSAEAAKSTTVLIESAVTAVDKGTKIAAENAKSLELIVSKVTTVSANVSDIATASERQAEAIAQVTSGIDQISAVVQTNSATAEQSAAASEELSGQAYMLKNLVGKFQLKEDAGMTDTFLTTEVDEPFAEENLLMDINEASLKY